ETHAPHQHPDRRWRPGLPHLPARPGRLATAARHRPTSASLGPRTARWPDALGSAATLARTGSKWKRTRDDPGPERDASAVHRRKARQVTGPAQPKGGRATV